MNYPGKELELFEKARNWKTYFARFINPNLSGAILEVGAGLGGTTSLLDHHRATHWVLLEPDQNLADQLKKKIEEKILPPHCECRIGTVRDLSAELYDAILYIDVMEHIHLDREEFRLAATHLKPGGILIILSPAHDYLFSPFDNAIGHFRRYNKQSLLSLNDGTLHLESFRYLDSAGWFASMVNKWFLKQDYPGEKQIKFWDRFLVPISVFTDKVMGYRFGKTVLGIWSKPHDPSIS